MFLSKYENGILHHRRISWCWDRLAIMKTRVWERLIVICIDKQHRFNEKLIHSGWQMQVHWLDHLLCSQHQRYLSPQAYHLLHSWLTLSALIPFSLILQVVNHHRNKATSGICSSSFMHSHTKNNVCTSNDSYYTVSRLPDEGFWWNHKGVLDTYSRDTLKWQPSLKVSLGLGIRGAEDVAGIAFSCSYNSTKPLTNRKLLDLDEDSQPSMAQYILNHFCVSLFME